MYEQSVEQLKGKVHRVNDGRLPRAKQFYSFKPVSGNGKLINQSKKFSAPLIFPPQLAVQVDAELRV